MLRGVLVSRGPQRIIQSVDVPSTKQSRNKNKTETKHTTKQETGSNSSAAPWIQTNETKKREREHTHTEEEMIFYIMRVVAMRDKQQERETKRETNKDRWRSWTTKQSKRHKMREKRETLWCCCAIQHLQVTKMVLFDTPCCCHVLPTLLSKLLWSS